LPLKLFTCPTCGFEKETLSKTIPECPEHKIPLQPTLKAPHTLFLETINPATNKKKPRGFDKMIKARARNYARDVDGDELIQLNKINGITQKAFLNKDGARRRKIDDI